MDFKELTKLIKSGVKEGRELSYEEGSVGITSLLQCPLKVELRKQYPDIKSESVEIDDGYLWEQQVKSGLKTLYKDGFVEEKDLIYEIDGMKIHGHLDCFIENDNEVIGIELKSPKLIIAKKVIPQEKVEGGYYSDDEGLIIHNPIYEKQAKIQKYILKKLYPNKEVKQYLFYKGIVKYNKWSAKLYISSEIKDDLTDEEMMSIINAFRENKGPRFVKECETYCSFYGNVCQGKDFVPTKQHDEDIKKAVELIKTYKSLEEDLKAIEKQLKKMLQGSITIGDKTYGWVKKRSEKIDMDKALDKALEKYSDDIKFFIKDYFMIKWFKKDDLISDLGSDIIERIEEITEWKL